MTERTVVIADDSPVLRRIVSSVLAGAGYRVVTAVDGLDAVQAVFRTQPDAVVLDVQMPRLSGYVAARLLSEDWQTAHIPVVMLTSLDSATDRYWGTQTGASAYLTKDFTPSALVAAIEAAGPLPALRPDEVELSEEEVMSRVADLLDRKLFETSVAAAVTEIAASTSGLEPAVGRLLELLAQVVDYDLAGVLLVEERAAYLSVARPCAPAQYQAFLTAAAEAVGTAAGAELAASELTVRVCDPQRHLDPDAFEEGEGPMATFLSMPLRGHGGEVIGLLALSSASGHAFGETALSTLRLVEGPAAVVVDNARMAGARASHR